MREVIDAVVAAHSMWYSRHFYLMIDFKFDIESVTLESLTRYDVLLQEFFIRFYLWEEFACEKVRNIENLCNSFSIKNSLIALNTTWLHRSFRWYWAIHFLSTSKRFNCRFDYVIMTTSPAKNLSTETISAAANTHLMMMCPAQTWKAFPSYALRLGSGVFIFSVFPYFRISILSQTS